MASPTLTLFLSAVPGFLPAHPPARKQEPFAPGQSFRTDTEDEFAILFPLGGRYKAEVALAGQVSRLQGAPRQVLVIPPHTRADWSWMGNPPLQFRVPSGSLEWQSDRRRPNFSITRFRHDHELAALCGQLWREMRSSEVGSDVSVQALTQLIRVHVLRHGCAPVEDSHKGGLPPRRLQAVLQWIEANLGRSLPLTDLSAVSGLSPQHFCRMFKRSVGVSPHRYITTQRIERAKAILKNSDRSLVDIALETGFPSQSHFGSTFRKVTGMTPGQYRAAV